MMNSGVVFFIVMWAIFVAVPAAAFSEGLIRCKVCERAVHHVWHKGVELRTLCRATPDDSRCDMRSIHPHVVDQMVWGVCEALPKSYQAIHESEFDLIQHDDPQHSEELAELIKVTCIKFVHDEHGVDEVGRLIMANLEAGKATDTILRPLQVRFCENICGEDDDPEF